MAQVVKHDKEYAQYLLDKWFWRNWQLFSIVTGFHMDYLTPLESRTGSFKEFMQEWIIDQYLSSLDTFGLKKPWYWEIFLDALESYHHMVYLSAYTYRATSHFNFVVPGPKEREWLAEKYPKYWDQFDQVWQRIDQKWSEADIGNDFAVHGTSAIGYCDTCQLVLCNGTPQKNNAIILEYKGKKFILCSEPCRWMFEKEIEKYSSHESIVSKILEGKIPGNLIGLIQQYFGLDYDSWGKDIFKGDYPWIKRGSK